MAKTLFLTVLALIAFAANSVLCRLALDGGAIDAAGFTVIRLVAGAVVLLVFWVSGKRRGMTGRGGWMASLMLFVYALAFSYAYITLETGTGALILFGAVQISMIVLSFMSGDRLRTVEWAGLLIAFSGLVYLVLPGVSAPSPAGFVLMSVSGVAWGVYTLIGRNSASPVMDTACNFLRTIPLAVLLAIVTLRFSHYSLPGILLAVLSGGLASGVGYTLWYMALNGLSAARAAVVQLLVPVIAAAGGVVFVSETVTLRLMLSAALVLGGVMLVALGHYSLSWSRSSRTNGGFKETE